MPTKKLNETIDVLQAALVWFVVAVITICIAVLFLFDALAGTGTMLYLTAGKTWQSVIISLATTGLLFALMFIGYMMVGNRNSLIKGIGFVVLGISGIVYVDDIVFDSLLADVLRYGTIDLDKEVDLLQWMFRGLMGGISTVGDALALAMIMGMPVMKGIINGAIGHGSSHNSHPSPHRSASSSYPSHHAPSKKQESREDKERRHQQLRMEQNKKSTPFPIPPRSFQVIDEGIDDEDLFHS